MALPAIILVGVLAILGVLLLRDKPRIPVANDRLNRYADRRGPAPVRADRTAPLAKIDAAVTRRTQGNRLARDLARADLKLTVTEFILLKATCALIGAGLGASIGRASAPAMLLVALIGGLLGSFIPNLYIGWAARARVKKFNGQLGDTINMLANSLRSGYSFLQSLDLVGREAPDPTAIEFRRVVQEVGLGLSVDAALLNLLKRVPSDDLDLLITAFNIQMETGGNLAQILETISHTIRERVRIKGEVAVLTAQGRISAWVITLLPIALAIFISLVNPTYMAPLFTIGLPPQAWICLPILSLIMIIIGFFFIMRIVDIEV